LRRTLLALATALLCSQAAHAFAYNGWVSGRMLYFDARSYAAAAGQGPYTASMKNTWRGVRYAKVYVMLNGSPTIIGSGATDSGGNFTVAWSSAVSNPSVVLVCYLESSFALGSTPRFRIANASGGNWSSYTNPITAVSGGVSSFGNLYYGSSSYPDKLYTLFATATDFWVTLGASSNVLLNELAGVQVRYPVTSGTDAYTVSRTRIDLTANGNSWVVFNNSVLAHELGHVVQEIAWEQDAVWGDCSWNGATHSWDSTEWQSCASTEGFADFVSAATFFYQAASNPTTYGYNIEAGCSGNYEWSESNVARMFWDLYDSPNESYDSYQQPFYWFVDKMDVFGDGTASRQDREGSVNTNGVNAWDFYYHALNSGNGANVNIQNAITLNCLGNSQW